MPITQSIQRIIQITSSGYFLAPYTILMRHYFEHLSDKDECMEGEDDCDVNANCINTAGSFECECVEGYRQINDGREGNCRGK